VSASRFVSWRLPPRPWRRITPGHPATGGSPSGTKTVVAIDVPSSIVSVESCLLKIHEGAIAGKESAATSTRRRARTVAKVTAGSGTDGSGPRRSSLPPMDARPIGVFDSGMGGLTVLHECLVTMPHEDFVYLGDAARLPYGLRPLAEVARFAHEIGAFLEGQGVKLILVACNTATSAALPELQEALSVPVVGVITPEAHAAVQTTRNRRIGLLATAGTVASGRYEALVWTLDAGVRVTSVACPRLVPLIESDDPFGPDT